MQVLWDLKLTQFGDLSVGEIMNYEYNSYYFEYIMNIKLNTNGNVCLEWEK